MKLDNIPDSLYVLIALLIIAVLHYSAPTATTETLLIGLSTGLLGLSRNRGSGGTSLVQTGANAQVVTEDPKKA